jgi:deoxyribodipyrimidine photolyase-related protein
MSDIPAGPWVADWDALYWTFIEDHRPVFAANPRSRMVVNLLDGMDAAKLDTHRSRARELLDGARHERLVTTRS